MHPLRVALGIALIIRTHTFHGLGYVLCDYAVAEADG